VGIRGFNKEALDAAAAGQARIELNPQAMFERSKITAEFGTGIPVVYHSP
jgi:hypothetical protein